jgi:hypothetical protein
MKGLARFKKTKKVITGPLQIMQRIVIDGNKAIPMERAG